MCNQDEFERENVVAKVRLESLDVLEPHCNWSNPCPTLKEQQARERWHWLMNKQSEFETKYQL